MAFSYQDLLAIAILATLIAIPIVLWKRKKKIASGISCFVVALLFVAIALPGLKKERNLSQRAACICNLEVIQRVKTEWAKENKKGPFDVPTENDLVGVGKQLSEMPKCPAGGMFSLGAVNQKPTCSLARLGHAIPDEAH